MKISWIKYKDDDSFEILRNFGMKVYDIDNLDKVDEKITELLENDYRTIVLSNEIASFSEDIIKKYQKTEDIRIIITPTKK